MEKQVMTTAAKTFFPTFVDYYSKYLWIFLDLISLCFISQFRVYSIVM